MTPNPHRGSDFADFLAEEGLMTPTMTPTNNLPAQLREFNRWRRCDEAMEQPSAAWVGAVIDAAADRLEELERQLASKDAQADEIYKAALDLAAKLEEDLAAERALADRLADALVESMERLGVCAGHRKVLDQWTKAREP
jgi:hypothetical protein